MKKIIAFVLVMVLTFSMAFTAFAADYEISKQWQDEEGNLLEAGEYPDIELEFQIISKEAEDYSNSAYDNEEQIPDITVIKPAGSSEFVISGTDLIEGVGLFSYIIDEKDPGVSGAVIDNERYKVQVLVTYVQNPDGSYSTDTEVSQVVVSKNSDPTVKVDTVVNVYTVSNLTIQKEVTGNLSREDEEFTIKLSFSSSRAIETDIVMPDGKVVEFQQDSPDSMYYCTATITLSAQDGPVTITGIPANVCVTVSEPDCEPYSLESYSVDGVSSTDAPVITMGADDVSVVITNNYETEIDTGISLDSLPYIIVLAAAGCGAAWFFIKKRQAAFDAE